MYRFSAARPARCLLLALAAFALVSCGGDDTGAELTIPNSVVVADLKGDGVLDVAVASARIDQTGLTQPPSLLAVNSNSATTPGTFATRVSYVVSAGPTSGLAVGDLT